MSLFLTFPTDSLQNSLTFTGIHVLRIMKYDRQALTMRRVQCENVDADPIVWTNQKFIRWARSIDLGEYADNLKGLFQRNQLGVLPVD